MNNNNNNVYREQLQRRLLYSFDDNNNNDNNQKKQIMFVEEKNDDRGNNSNSIKNTPKNRKKELIATTTRKLTSTTSTSTKQIESSNNKYDKNDQHNSNLRHHYHNHNNFIRTVPIVRTIIAHEKSLLQQRKMNAEERFLLDISTAFIYSFRNDVFRTKQLRNNNDYNNENNNNNNKNQKYNSINQKQQQQQNYEITYTEQEYKTIIGWLELVSISLPPEWAVQTSIQQFLLLFRRNQINTTSTNTTINTIHEIIQLQNELLNNIEKVRMISTSSIKKQKYYKQQQQNCYLGINDCGFWKLLHTISIGFVIQQQQKGIDSSNDGTSSSLRSMNTMNPIEAVRMIRNYIQLFHQKTYTCTTNNNNNDNKQQITISTNKKTPDHCFIWQDFINQYDQCHEYTRCTTLLAITTNNVIDDDYNSNNNNNNNDNTDAYYKDWKEFPLWIWEFHNYATLKMNSNKDNNNNNFISTKKDSSSSSSSSLTWPTKYDCKECFTTKKNNYNHASIISNTNNNYQYVDDEVFRFLQEQYWPGLQDEIEYPNRIQSWWINHEHGRLTIMILSLALITVLVTARLVSRTSSMHHTMMTPRQVLLRTSKTRNHKK